MSLWCKLLGHNWTIEPPWTGKEIHWNPHCQRCDQEPEDIVITGSANEIEHRTPKNQE